MKKQEDVKMLLHSTFYKNSTDKQVYVICMHAYYNATLLFNRFVKVFVDVTFIGACFPFC